MAPLQALLDEAARSSPRPTTVAAAHAASSRRWRATRSPFEGFAVAFATDDPAALAEAQAAREQVDGTRLRWLERVAALGGG